jgi:hypothetical protein
MSDYTCPMVSTLGILEPMNPLQPGHHYNSWVGPLVSSDWNMPTTDMGYNFQVSEPVPGALRHLHGVPEAMKVFDAVNFLFPV